MMEISRNTCIPQRTGLEMQDPRPGLDGLVHGYILHRRGRDEMDWLARLKRRDC